MPMILAICQGFDPAQSLNLSFAHLETKWNVLEPISSFVGTEGHQEGACFIQMDVSKAILCI